MNEKNVRLYRNSFKKFPYKLFVQCCLVSTTLLKIYIKSTLDVCMQINTINYQGFSGLHCVTASQL